MSEQEDRELQQIRNQIAFGLDCKVFMESPIGRYLTKRANDEIESAMQELRHADPDSSKTIRDLQNKAYRAESFLQWMGEAVTEGENAERTFIEAND
jgi:hypothetical protein